MATPQQRRSSSWANDSPQHPRAALPAAFKIDHRQKSSLWPKAMGRWQREALTEGPWRNVAAPPPLPPAAVPSPSLRDREDQLRVASRDNIFTTPHAISAWPPKYSGHTSNKVTSLLSVPPSPAKMNRSLARNAIAPIPVR